MRVETSAPFGATKIGCLSFSVREPIDDDARYWHGPPNRGRRCLRDDVLTHCPHCLDCDVNVCLGISTTPTSKSPQLELS
jgi:hypothetical protein